jgi:hypothetical protein
LGVGVAAQLARAQVEGEGAELLHAAERNGVLEPTERFTAQISDSHHISEIYTIYQRFTAQIRDSQHRSEIHTTDQRFTPQISDLHHISAIHSTD